MLALAMSWDEVGGLGRLSVVEMQLNYHRQSLSCRRGLGSAPEK